MIPMEKWARIKYMPVLPLGENRTRITGCQAHVDLSRRAAEEGIVLLKNENNALPLKKGTKVAIFGKGQSAYFKCGGGSGDVYSEYTRNIYKGLQLKAEHVEVFEPLSEFYEKYVRDLRAGGLKMRLIEEPSLDELFMHYYEKKEDLE